MPRKKLIRHFEPRYGVSQSMVDVEATYVAREHEDYMLLSVADLRKRLETLRNQWREADEAAERLLHGMNERELLGWQCLVTRDYYLMLELYGTCLRAVSGQPTEPPSAPDQRVEKKTLVKREEKVLPFSDWLFEPSK